MKKKSLALVISLFAIVATTVLAGTPLSQVKFYSVYQSNQKVQLAEQRGILDGEIAFYLMDESVSLDNKAAVINALAWGEKGKNNTDAYKMFLGRKYKKSYLELNPAELSGDELFCLGYMISMDESRDLSEAIPLLERAKSNNEKSFIVNLMYSLSLAQVFINDSEECKAWQLCNNLRNNEELIQDMNQLAVDMIFDSIDEYKVGCE
ncbi:MAG: hypothetical protein B6D61_14425 [Bacteroidetes bacterium 4484_249]|nr:MAG: hypothetical protein B6D61_14425 [Bacteroidetes bacterium 4484_249]